MSVSIQIMSGDVHSVSIYHRYRIVNLRAEVSTILSVDSDRLSFFTSEHEEVEEMDEVYDGELYYVFVRDASEITTDSLRYENGRFSVWRDGEFLEYCGFGEGIVRGDCYIRNQDFSQEVYDAMRENIHNEWIEMDADIYDVENIPDEDVFDIFHRLFIGVGL